jgi:hypothetical protein
MQLSFSPQMRRRAWLSAGLVLLATAVAWATTSGPDVTVIDVTGVGNYTTTGPVSGYRGYAVGATSCNVGDQPVWWCDSSTGYCTADQHPVIAQNLYRLDAGRFQQIGLGWLKHGFLSTNSSNSACNPAHPCAGSPHGGDQLGLGCTDTYGSGLNGTRPLGMRSEVNVTDGTFPYPYTAVGTSTAPDQRVKVLDSDLDPLLHPGSLFWAEVQYVTADDAKANNGLNNASYRAVTVGPAPARNISNSGSTVREKSALYAWKAADAAVEIANADFASPPSTVIERFEGASRVTDHGDGTWHWEVAIHNVNSQRAARAYSIAFPIGTTVLNAGSHVIAHHSGEPYTTEDWTADVTDNVVTWSTDDFATNANANALRWASTFSFWVDTDQPPQAGSTHTLTLFEPGSPTEVQLPFAAIFADGFERAATPWAGSFP